MTPPPPKNNGYGYRGKTQMVTVTLATASLGSGQGDWWGVCVCLCVSVCFCCLVCVVCVCVCGLFGVCGGESEIFFPFSPSHKEFGPGVDSPTTMVRSGLPHPSGWTRGAQFAPMNSACRPHIKGGPLSIREV